jgi:hypothetical protein
MPTPPATDPRWLLEQTRGLLDRADPVTAGRWPRAAALLARQALEAGTDLLLAERAPGAERSRSGRAKLLCLRRFAGAEVALPVEHAWVALSHACHHHAYELPPTAGELRGWLDVVEEFLATSLEGAVDGVQSPETTGDACDGQPG